MQAIDCLLRVHFLDFVHRLPLAIISAKLRFAFERGFFFVEFHSTPRKKLSFLTSCWAPTWCLFSGRSRCERRNTRWVSLVVSLMVKKIKNAESGMLSAFTFEENISINNSFAMRTSFCRDDGKSFSFHPRNLTVKFLKIYKFLKNLLRITVFFRFLCKR